MTASHQEAWKHTLLSPGTTLRDAIRNLDETALQIIMVIDAAGVLLGTVTDGDIRRALLRDCDMQTVIAEIMFRTPLVAPSEIGRDMVLHLMQANKLRQLPIVDSSRKVVGLHLWDEVVVQQGRPNAMVIMAGGLGRRLLPYTEDCPKPMLPVGGKPMLEHIIERARVQGFSHFVLAVRYLSHMVESHFGDGAKFGVRIEYVHEESPLGTAGAISLIDPVPELPFIVTNGDVLTDIHYGEILDFHERHQAAATMAVRLHEWQHPFGVVHTEGINITGFEEKPVHRTHVNAGIYVLSPRALAVLVPGEACDMPTLFQRLQAQAGNTIAYPMHEPWLDVGRPDDLERARNNLLK